MFETVKNTLNENSNITPEVRENLLELIEVLNSKLSDIDLSNLNERLKTLIIRRESKYLVKLPCQYNPHNNEILINLGEFEKCDTSHWLMRALLTMTTAKENHFGFNNEEGQLTALNEGYTDMIASYLAGDIDNNFYTDEIIITNLIAKAIGEDIFYDAYFSNEPNQILEAMVKSADIELSEEERDKLLADFNNDLVSRTNGLPTNPFEKQGRIAEIYKRVVREFPEYFCLSPEYYPDESRDLLDVENLEETIRKFNESREAKPDIEIEHEEIDPVELENIDSELEQAETKTNKIS